MSPSTNRLNSKPPVSLFTLRCTWENTFSSSHWLLSSGLLSFLANDQEFQEILLITTAVVGTIRISAYITEDLSRDLAKILPFGVLAFVIIDLSSFDASDSLEILRQADDNRETILYYLGFTVVLEFSLRFVSGAVSLFRSKMLNSR